LAESKSVMPRVIEHLGDVGLHAHLIAQPLDGSSVGHFTDVPGGSGHVDSLSEK
jgi:hypothetical protein